MYFDLYSFNPYLIFYNSLSHRLTDIIINYELLDNNISLATFNIYDNKKKLQWN